MPEAKTEIIPLNSGSLAWDSQYNISSVSINMVADTNGRLLSIPVNYNVYVFKDFSFSPASENVSILAIMRASKSQGAYNSSYRLNEFISDYAVITTNYRPSSWVPADGLCSITVFRINELTHDALFKLEIHNSTDGVPLLNPNFMNRGDFSFAQNGYDECLFVDDTPQLWYFQITTTATTAPKIFNFRGARVEYLSGAVKWGTLGSMGSNNVNSGTTGVAITDDISEVSYRTLFDVIAGNKFIVVVLQDYGVIYNASQNLFFFTEPGDFSKILFEYGKWPKYSGSATMVYNSGNWTGSGAQLGIPLTYFAPGRVVDMVGINSSLYVFTQDSIYRYNLVIVNNDPTLQQDTSFNMHYKIRLNSNALVYQNAMYFITEDDKMYSLSTKGVITELSSRILPDKYYFSFNQFTLNGLIQHYYSPRILIPMKIFNMNCIIENYSAINLDTGNFLYILPNKNLQYSWNPTPTTTAAYNQPKRITAANDTGRYIGLQNILQYVPTDFENAISNLDANADYFSCGVFISKQYTFAGKQNGKLTGISITFRDSNFDPALYQTFDAITLGLYIIRDNAFDADLIANISNDSWWNQYNKTFNRSHSVNVFSIKLNLDCQSFIVCMRFSNFTLPPTPSQPQFELQKFAVENIMLNILE